ncbi:hypothetical protein WJU23_04160 [Prosthecobacter sp. SYSU 5D2]|uniref:hypothetical protein n=1 Tax=Prosthecobacter sp. SYSU 5D2 TaxID=3134134 RepID=UPI0031FF17BA
MWRKIMVLIWGIVLPGPLLAHVDPAGDTYPQVMVEDGRFLISFTTRLAVEKGDPVEVKSAVIYEPDGSVFIPRHRVNYPERKNQFSKVEFRSTSDIEEQELLKPGETPKREENRLHRAVLIEHPYDLPQRVERPLPIEITASSPYADKASFNGEQVAFIWSDDEEEQHFSAHHLHLSMASLNGSAEDKTLPLGKVATIYDFPAASSPLWAAGRWWVAWVQESGQSQSAQDERWQTLLSSYDPVTQKLEHQALPGISHWNSSLSIAATEGWLCIAWHASQEGRYPGSAKIVTAFVKMPAVKE